MTRFVNTQTSDTGAMNDLADRINQVARRTITAITTGSSSTAAVAAFLNGIFKFSGGSTYTLTTPTAAQIVAAMQNVVVGSSLTVSIYNANSGTTTITGGTGVTVTGASTVATSKALTYDIVVTNATAGSEAVEMIPRTFAAA